MKNQFILTLAASLFLITGTPALAQEKNDLAAECLSALVKEDSSRANEIAGEIETWENLRSTKLRIDARKCLEGVTGKKWVYNVKLKRFIDRIAFAQTRQNEEAKKAALLPRKCELREAIFDLEKSVERLEDAVDRAERDRVSQVLEVTVNQCQDWFEEDQRAALTNDICSNIFTEIGLPGSEYHELLAQTQSDLAEERSKLRSAEWDLRIIDEHNLTPEEYAEQGQEKTDREALIASIDEMREEDRRKALGDECLE